MTASQKCRYRNPGVGLAVELNDVSVCRYTEARKGGPAWCANTTTGPVSEPLDERDRTMSISVSMPIASGAPGDRRVASRIKGVAVTLPCPRWCTQNHGLENHLFLEDFSHAGEPVEVTDTRGEEILSARLVAWPHCEVGTKVALDFDGTSVEYDAAQLEALADQLITVASKLRGMARTIGGAA